MKARAFTLVEILVVVIIIGIAGAIIAPQISSRDDLTASAASRMMMADLIYAQNLAITHQRNHYVAFNATDQNYSVLSGSAMTVVSHPISKEPFVIGLGAGGVRGMEEVTLVSADFRGASSTSHATLGFDELGTPLVRTSGGTIETLSYGRIIVRSSVFQMNIDIEPYTGQISVSAN